MKSRKKSKISSIKKAARQLGLRKPVKLLVSSEFRYIRQLTKELKAEFESRGFSAIRKKFKLGVSDYEKYLDLDSSLEDSITAFLRLGLNHSRPLRILDIGCGPGYFLHVSKRYANHEVVGIDVDEMPMLNELVRMVGIPRIVHRVSAFEPLPEIEGSFDLITAQGIVFDLHRTEDIWGAAEWKFFVDDCKRRLRPNGKLFLAFNPATTQTFDFIPEEVAHMLRNIPGGQLSESKEYFTLFSDESANPATLRTQAVSGMLALTEFFVQSHGALGLGL